MTVGKRVSISAIIFFAAFGASARVMFKSKPFTRFHLLCTYAGDNAKNKDKHFSVKAYSEHDFGTGPISEVTVKIFPSREPDHKKQKPIAGPYYLELVKELEFSDPKAGIKFVFHGEEKEIQTRNGDEQGSGKADFYDKEQRSQLECQATKFLHPE